MAVEMGREYVVFCLDMLEYGREGKFGYFLHEADYLLLSLAEHAPKMPAKAGKVEQQEGPGVHVGALCQQRVSNRDDTGRYSANRHHRLCSRNWPVCRALRTTATLRGLHLAGLIRLLLSHLSSLTVSSVAFFALLIGAVGVRWFLTCSLLRG